MVRFVLLLAALWAGASANAADYPTKPIRVIVPYAAGSTGEAALRVIANAIEPKLGQPIVIETRPGAAGNLGAAFVAKADPDGYTLLLGATNNFAINQYLYPNIGFDPLTAFAAAARSAARRFAAAPVRFCDKPAPRKSIGKTKKPSPASRCAYGSHSQRSPSDWWARITAGVPWRKRWPTSSCVGGAEPVPPPEMEACRHRSVPPGRRDGGRGEQRTSRSARLTSRTSNTPATTCEGRQVHSAALSSRCSLKVPVPATGSSSTSSSRSRTRGPQATARSIPSWPGRARRG